MLKFMKNYIVAKVTKYLPQKKLLFFVNGKSIYDMLSLIVYRKSFGMVAGAMNKLANAMENGEYDFDGTHEKMV